VRLLLVKIKTSFGSCICNYADKTSDDTSVTPEDIENDSLKDDKQDLQNAMAGKQWESRL